MKTILATTLLTGLTLGSCAHVRPVTDATSSLAAAERAFAADAQTRTANEAFLAALADDGLLLRAQPVNGHAYLAEHPMAAALHLWWTPTYAETSSDGTLGFTTGPYESGQRGKKPTGSGHFLSVWRNTNGKWQLVFDGGAVGPIETSVDSAMKLLRTHANTGRFSPDTLSLLNLERSLSSQRAEPARAIVAPSGDLGYVYGMIGGQAYLRIYRRDRNGNWQLAISSLDPHVR